MPKRDEARVKKLSDVGIERLRYHPSRAESGPGSRMVIHDETVRGLQLRVTPNVKAFCVYLRPATNQVGKRGSLRKGKQRRITIGHFPAMGIAAAREEAREILNAAEKGRDPWAERKKANQHRYSNLFESVVEQFVATKKGEIKTADKIERVLNLHVKPKWEGKPVADISRKDARELLDGIKAKGTAREVRKHLHTLFEWAIDEEIVAKNPLHKRQNKGSKKKDRLAPTKNAGRSLERKELKAVWRAAEGLGYPFGPWFQLLLLTGQRRADWAAAMRSELKSESEMEQEDIRAADGAKGRFVLEIPANRFKSEREHVVPLTSAAWKIIAGLPKWEGNDYFLFSGRAGKTHISGYSKAKARLDRDALALLRKEDPAIKLPRFRVHDLRVSCRTRLTHLGIEEDIAEAVIGHAQGLLSETYNKHDYIAQKREALTKYADWLLEVVT